MKMITLTTPWSSLAVRIFSPSEMWRVFASRLVLRIFYENLDSPGGSASAPIDTSSELNVAMPAAHQRKKIWNRFMRVRSQSTRPPSTLFFQTVAPRFGNHIISLIVLHHMTKGFPSSRAVQISAPKWLATKNTVWHGGSVPVAAKRGLGNTIWQNTVISHDSFLLPEAVHDFSEAARRARGDILSLVKIPTPTKAPPADILTIHMRGGDVYSRRPHPAYVPPPLAFYTAVIMSAQWSKVRIVREDTNPMFEALASWLEEKEMFWEANQPDFNTDVVALGSAVSLVAGQGTFIPAIAYLSASIEKIYAFRPQDFLWVPPRSATVVSPSGDWDSYRDLQGAWRASNEQIKIAKTWNMPP